MSLQQHICSKLNNQEWVDIPEGWLQGRTIYGGLVAGMMMHKALVTVAMIRQRAYSVAV